MADVKVNFKGDHSSVDNSVSKVKSGITSIGTAAKGLGGVLKSAFLPLFAVGAALGGLTAVVGGVKDVISLGGDLEDLSVSTGIAVKELVLLQEAFKLAGVNGDLVGKAVTGLSVKLNQPTPKIIETINNLGLSLSDLQAMPVGEQFAAISRGIGNLSSESDRAAVSSALFGKALGQGLIPLFADPTLFDTASQSVGQLGITMEDNAGKFAKIGDALDSVITKVRQFFASVVGANADRLVEIADKFMGIDLTKAGQQAGEMLNTVIQIANKLLESFGSGTLGQTFSDSLTLAWLNFKPLFYTVLQEGAALFATALIEGMTASFSLFSNTTLGKNLKQLQELINVKQELDREERTKKGFLTPEDIARKKEIEDRLKLTKEPKLGPELPPPVRRVVSALGPMFGPALPTDAEKKAMVAGKDTKASSLFEKLFGSGSEMPTTSLQRRGGASALTGSNLALTEQKETNNILRQIKELLGDEVKLTPAPSVPTFA